MREHKVAASHRIGGVILIILSSFLCLLIIPMFALGESELIFPVLFGFVCMLVGISLCRGKFMRFEQDKKRKGIYLTHEQIEKLESEIELPVVDTPVFLNSGEIAVYYSQAIRDMGRHSFDGELVITTQRTIFLNDRKGFEVKHQNITSATSYKNGLSIQSRNTTYVLMIPRVDLAVLAFDGVRTGEIPIAGTVVDYEEASSNEDFDEREINNVSMVDGMEGHEFEHFCADLLRKNGFADVSVTRGSGDQGVDVLATKGGIKYAIQCKNYASPLSNTPVQEVSAGKIFYNCHVGVVLTNSTFTPGAISLANATGVLLWDRSTLAELMRNEQPATEKAEEMPVETQFDIQPKETTFKGMAAKPIAPAPQVKPRPNIQQSPNQKKSIRIDNIDIDIDATSADRFGIIFNNFGIEIDEDDDDQLELLFDIVSRNGRSILCNIDIVCNLYVGSRKVTTERETVYKDSFDGRDSVSIYFEKKNIAKTATRIELFCQKW